MEAWYYKTTGYPYFNDLDGSNLYFYFPLSDTSYQLLDSITDIVVRKSKGDVKDECHIDDPNVRLDQVSLVHMGESLSQNDTIVLRR